MNAHLPAVLHRKIAGIPVWGIGLGGGLAFGLYRRFHSPGVGGAQGDTTPASGVGDGTGDPLPADSGTFPYSMPNGNGSVPGGGGGDYSSAIGGLGDSITGLGDLIANAPQPVDYSQQIGDLTLAVGALRDQQPTDHGQNPDKPEPKPLAHKAAALHATAVGSRGGHATKPPAKHAAKPAAHPAHPKHPAAHPAAKPAHAAHTPPKHTPAPTHPKHPKKGK